MSTSGLDANPGTEALPVATLNRAIALAGAGGTVVVRGGTYRDGYTDGSGTYKVLSTPLTIQAYPHEQPWFDGTDVEPTADWTSDGAGHWSMAWSTPQFCAGGYYDYAYNAQPMANTGPCTHYDMYGDPSNPAAGDPQMVFIDGAYVHEVTALADATAGNFFYDWTNKRIYIATNPSGHTVELAARPVALVLAGTGGNAVKGIGFRRYATNEYSNVTSGAVYASEPTTVENCVFTGMAAQGVYLNGTGGVLKHSVLALNGFNGMGSNGHQHSTGSPDGLVIEDSLIVGNNTEKFGTGCSVSCAQAGVKIAHMDGFTLQDNILANNNGSGFWCDLACSNGVMVDNASYGNQGSGLFYEVSDTGIIASNLVHDNVGYGIRVGSANTAIFNNTVVNNTQYGGIWVYDDSRSPGVGGWTDVGPDTVNVAFENNIVVDTLASNTLLRITASSTTAPNTQPSQFFSALDFNAYYRTSAGQNLVRWIPSSGETDYKSASAFSAAQGWDGHSIDVSNDTVPFVDMDGGNYAVDPSSPAHGSATALPADVAAALGVSASAVRDRGALNWPGQ